MIGLSRPHWFLACDMAFNLREENLSFYVAHLIFKTAYHNHEALNQKVSINISVANKVGSFAINLGQIYVLIVGRAIYENGPLYLTPGYKGQIFS